GRGRLLGQLAADVPEKRAEVLKLAVEQFGKASGLGAHSADFLYEYGHTLANAGDLPAAIDKFTEALKLKPDDVKLLYERGEARLFTGDPPQIRQSADDFA